MRWFVFDQGESVTWRAQSSGLPGLPGDGFAEFQAGLAAWTNDPGSHVLYSYGGTTTARGGFAAADGLNTILFDDPNDEIPGTYDCYSGGTLAIGGPWFSGTASFNGTTYYMIQEGDIVVQDGAACLLGLHGGLDGAEVFAHELGHTLGLDHSALSEALMYYQAHVDGRGAVLTADDQAGIAALYPAAAPVLPVAAPASLAVPANSSTGSYTVTWSASATTGAGYQLQEATDPGFSSGLRTAYSGSATSAVITGRADGTWYYRVKAVKSGLPDSAWTTAVNGCQVTLAPAVAPATLLVPAESSTGSFVVSWSASPTAGAGYELQEATDSGFRSGLRTAYSGNATSIAMSGKEDGTWYYRVKAVKAGLPDSAWTTAANGCTVTIPVVVDRVAPPASLTVPATSDTGSYRVSWGASSTTGVAYQLQEATDSLFSAGLRLVYDGTATSVTISGRSDGSYFYRVKATRSGYADSDWQAAGNGCLVSLGSSQALAPPAQLMVPTTSSSGSYVVTWSPSATAGVTYVLQEAGAATFTAGLREAYRGSATSAAISGRLNGSYFYRVKAVKAGLEDSPWVAGDNACRVSLTALRNGLRFVDGDEGLAGLRRSDGGSDGDNLAGGGRPSWELAYEFQVVLQDNSGAPPARVRLFLDGYGYDLPLVSGSLLQGALFSRPLQLGPAATHRFHFEAQDGAGNLVYRLPTSGELPGPQIALLNGYSQVGVPGAVSSTSLDPARLGGEKVYRWDSAGLDDGSGNGAYRTAAGIPLQVGEGLYLQSGPSPGTLPPLDQVAANSALESTVRLQPGWNLVSNPYAGEVPLAAVRVARTGGTTLTWEQAAASNWVVNALYAFKGSDWGGLYGFASAGGTPEAVLVPWRAYWLYLNRDDGSYVLKVPRPTLQGVFAPNG